jgi:hypothetical protein
MRESMDQNGKNGSNQLSKLMEETETDLVNKRITQQTLNRQKEILTRLLESEKAERERELDDKRESKQGKDKPMMSAEDFFKYNMKKETRGRKALPAKEKKQPLNSQNERTSEIFFVLLDNSSSDKWLTKEVHQNRLQSLYNLVTEIEKAINSNKLWFEEMKTAIDVKNFNRFGTETIQGFDRNIIDADLTGIEMKFTLVVRKQSCNC